MQHPVIMHMGTIPQKKQKRTLDDEFADWQENGPLIDNGDEIHKYANTILDDSTTKF